MFEIDFLKASVELLSKCDCKLFHHGSTNAITFDDLLNPYNINHMFNNFLRRSPRPYINNDLNGLLKELKFLMLSDELKLRHFERINVGLIVDKCECKLNGTEDKSLYEEEGPSSTMVITEPIGIKTLDDLELFESVYELYYLTIICGIHYGPRAGYIITSINYLSVESKKILSPLHSMYNDDLSPLSLSGSAGSGTRHDTTTSNDSVNKGGMKRDEQYHGGMRFNNHELLQETREYHLLEEIKSLKAKVKRQRFELDLFDEILRDPKYINYDNIVSYTVD